MSNRLIMNGFVVGVFILSLSLFSAYRYQRASLSWPAVDVSDISGDVVRVDFKMPDDQGGGIDGFKPQLTGTYSWEGHPYRIDLTTAELSIFASAKSARGALATLEKVARDNKVFVFVDPINPSYSILKRGTAKQRGHVIGAYVAGVILLFAFIGGILERRSNGNLNHQWIKLSLLVAAALNAIVSLYFFCSVQLVTKSAQRSDQFISEGNHGATIFASALASMGNILIVLLPTVISIACIVVSQKYRRPGVINKYFLAFSFILLLIAWVIPMFLIGHRGW